MIDFKNFRLLVANILEVQRTVIFVASTQKIVFRGASHRNISVRRTCKMPHFQFAWLQRFRCAAPLKSLT
jgi:hypothetical protein